MHEVELEPRRRIGRAGRGAATTQVLGRAEIPAMSPDGLTHPLIQQLARRSVLVHVAVQVSLRIDATVSELRRAHGRAFACAEGFRDELSAAPKDLPDHPSRPFLSRRIRAAEDQAALLEQRLVETHVLAESLFFSALVVIWQQAERHGLPEAAELAARFATSRFGRDVLLDRPETWPIAA